MEIKNMFQIFALPRKLLQTNVTGPPCLPFQVIRLSSQPTTLQHHDGIRAATMVQKLQLRTYNMRMAHSLGVTMSKRHEPERLPHERRMSWGLTIS